LLKNQLPDKSAKKLKEYPAMVKVDLFQHEQQYQLFSAGQTIFQEGEPGDVMYVVQEGEADILLRDHLLETVGPGGILGEMALIDTTSRSATAVARTDCKLVPINQTRFKVHVHHTPYFALQVMRVMADRLRQMNAQLR
jgi:CRP-like cAMP-binding protein